MRAVVTDGVVPLQPKFVCLSHSVCLSVCLSACLPVCLSHSVCLSFSLSVCPSVCLSACLSVGHDCDPRSEQTEMLFGLRIAVRGPVKIRRGLRNHVWCIIWARTVPQFPRERQLTPTCIWHWMRPVSMSACRTRAGKNLG